MALACEVKDDGFGLLQSVGFVDSEMANETNFFLERFFEVQDRLWRAGQALVAVAFSSSCFFFKIGRHFGFK